MVVGDRSERRVGGTQHRRLVFLLVAAGLWIGLLLGRLGHLQVVHHDALVERASNQHRWTMELPGKRGDLLDRQGRLLATSIDEVTIYAHPHLLDDRQRAAGLLAPALGFTVERLEDLLAGDGFVHLYRKAPPEVADAARAVVKEHELHLAIGFTPESKRIYPKSELAAQVIGFVDVDNLGQAGLEYAYDDVISGEPGYWLTYRDGGNRPIDPDGLVRREPTMGHDLTLTLDAVVQATAEEALEASVTRHAADAGVAVAMDPQTGAILAMASYPGFDPNDRDDPSFRRNWRNRAVFTAPEPGSTFKMLNAAAALDEGLVTEQELIDCEGGRFRVASHTYRDWKPGFGVMPFRDVLVNSSNVGMIKVMSRFEDRRFYEWLRRFGFGEPTGVDLPGDAPGMLKPPEAWSALSHASMSFGQEIGVTPLQLVTAASTVANGGALMEPYVVQRVQDTDGNVVEERSPRVRRRVLRPETAARVRSVLREVVDGSSGAGTNASIAGYTIAGKTGTAQKIGPGGAYSQYVSSFIGMLPASEPRVVILVMIDNPTRGYYGSVVAMPAFRAIAESAIHALRIPPDASTPSTRLLGTS